MRTQNSQLTWGAVFCSPQKVKHICSQMFDKLSFLEQTNPGFIRKIYCVVWTCLVRGCVLHSAFFFSPPLLVKGRKSEPWESQRWWWYPCGPGSRWAILLHSASPIPMLNSLSSLAASKAVTSSSFSAPPPHLLALPYPSLTTCFIFLSFIFPLHPCCPPISLPNLNFPLGPLRNLSLPFCPLCIFLLIHSSPHPPFLICHSLPLL